MSVVRVIAWALATAFMVFLAGSMLAYSSGRFETWIVVVIALYYLFVGAEWTYKRARKAWGDG